MKCLAANLGPQASGNMHLSGQGSQQGIPLPIKKRDSKTSARHAIQARLQGSFSNPVSFPPATTFRPVMIMIHKSRWRDWRLVCWLVYTRELCMHLPLAINVTPITSVVKQYNKNGIDETATTNRFIAHSINPILAQATAINFCCDVLTSNLYNITMAPITY